MKLLIEKYRPKSLKHFIGNQSVVNIIKNFIKEKHIPHLIISGTSSTGKTSLAHIIVNSLFEPSILEERVLEINASEDRGIRIIRNKIKKYVLSSIDTNNNFAKFKVIILDEADTLSMDSQYALRRIIEDSSKSTRFIMICNNTNNIIPPILSRCMILNLKPLSKEEIKKRLTFICTQENIDTNVIKSCMTDDIRQAISNLDKYNNGIISNNTINTIDWSFIDKSIPKEIVSKLNEFILDGYEASFLIENFLQYVISIKKLNLEQMEYLLNTSIDTYIRLCNGCSPFIQISNLLLEYYKDTKCM